jgi:indolepyruvate ferredoxin oxidoreductase alpha subunit
MMSHLIETKAGDRQLLMGNEAIARGALEAGISVAAGYPGTPSSDIIESLARAPQTIWFTLQFDRFYLQFRT